MTDSPETEQAKQEIADAQQAQTLREQITKFASDACYYGNVDRGWANQHLRALGAELIPGQNEYEISSPVSGNIVRTITGNTRAEAAQKFTTWLASATQKDTGSNVRMVGINPADEAPTFVSGPEDVSDEPVADFSLAELKAGIRTMLKRGIGEQDWGQSYAANAVEAMGLDALGAVHHRTLSVPVAGTSSVTVLMFADDDDATAVEVAARKAAKYMQLSVRPEEIGKPYMNPADAE